MSNRFFKSILAIVTVLGSMLGFVACETEGDNVVTDPHVEVSQTTLNFTNEESSQKVELTSNSEWKIEVKDADWVAVTPMAGRGDKSINITVAANTTGALREATIKVVALHSVYGAWDTKKVKVSQSATEDATVEETLLYGDNFDGEEATKTYGSGSSWPYIDQFPQFANPEGPASENVNYTGKGVSVRANSTSNSQYSDYAGSGSNNIFFGSAAYFQVNNITLDAATKSYKLTFGSEKYSQDYGSTFTTSEFHVYVSKNGNGWAELEYTFAGTEDGRWNVATAEFTLTEVPENLYIKFSADVASSYRLDDVKLFSGNGGQSVVLPEEGGGNGDGDGGNNEPIVAEGPYASDAAFVCATDDSANAAYTLGASKAGDYAASGFKLGKAKQAGKFTSTAIGVEGDKYLNFYAVGWSGGDATLYFRVNGGETKSQKLAANTTASNNPPFSLVLKASDHYSVKLTGLKATDTIEFSTDANFELTTADDTMKSARAVVCGVKLTDTAIEGQDSGTVTPSDVKKVTVKEFLAAAEDATTFYELTGVIDRMYRDNNENDTLYGNFYLKDSTGEVLIYGLMDANGNKYWEASGVKIGDTITVQTIRTSYNGTAQGKNATYISHTSGSGGNTDDGGNDDGNTDDGGNDDGGNDDGVYTSVAKFLALTDVVASDATAEEIAAAPRYTLKGTITSVTNTEYGNFYLNDGTGEVLIYGLCSPEGESKYWEASGAKVGDDIIVETIRTEYNGSPQGKNATFVELITPGTLKFWIFDTTAVSFTAAGGNKTIGLDIYNTTAEVKATSDNTQFSASYANGVLTIKANENTSSAAINGKITVTCDTLSQIVTVSQLKASSGSQTAVDVEITLNEDNRTTFTTSQQVFEYDGVKVINDKGSSTSNVADYVAPARFYKSSKVTVSAPGNITTIVFDCNSASYATALKDSITTGTVSVSSDMVTVVLDGSSNEYVIASLIGGQVRMDSVKVTYLQ